MTGSVQGVQRGDRECRSTGEDIAQEALTALVELDRSRFTTGEALARTNRQLHEQIQNMPGIESAVRKMVKKEGDLFVITGPAFIGGDLRKVGNVLVPSHLYKAVWSPRKGAGGAWFVANEADARVQTMTIAQLESRIGIDLIPSLTARQKEVMLKLPKTTKRKG